jgi:hypothetical protein
MSDLRIVPVKDKRGIEAFIAAARRAEAGNPRWVEPAHDEIRMTFDPKRAPFTRENVVQPFVAFRDGEPVGRIVATIETAHIARFDDSCGFFGFIEAIDDAQVFAELFGAAEGFLRERGMKVVRGPFSLTINHESGLLVHGFDEAHVVRTNHAPPYYGPRVEALGYRKAMDLVAYVVRVAESTLPERVARVASARGAPAIGYHALSLLSWRRDLKRVLDLYNDAWSDNAWATPVGDEEAKLISKLMLPVSYPGWIRIATYQGEDVAVAAHIPDANEALEGLEGKLLPFGAAKLMWRLHGRGVKRSRAPMTGIAKKWRNTRVAAHALSGLVARSILDARKAGVEEIEYSWMLETNEAALNSVRNLPARHTRTFRIYEKAI